MRHVVFLTKATPDPSRLGGKGSNLARLLRIRANVPPGFIVTSGGFTKFLKESRNRDPLAKLLSQYPMAKDVVNLSRSIRKLILDSEIPREIENELRIGFDRIRKEFGADTSFAVRSSATIEDMDSFSFAGQSDTYLNNNSFQQVLSSVRNCWASLFSMQSLAYLVQMGRMGKKYSLSDVRMAVIVQKMVDPQISGVLFTANVINGRKDQMMINSTWGLGEAIANNSVTPDMIVLEKSHLKILRTVVGKKEKMSIRNPKDLGTILIDTDPELRAKCSLNEGQLRNLVQLGLQLEDSLNSPQDIEWAIENGKVYILQSRPITTLNRHELA